MESEHDDGYEERTASMTQANVAAIVGVLPPLAVLAVGYGLAWGWGALGGGFNDLFEPVWEFLLLFIGGVVVHEALHGIAWRLAGAAPGSVRFGFQWKTLTPYAHSTEAMSARAYRIGAVTPGLVLGLVPALVGLAVGAGATFWFGLLFTLAAGGDALILWLLRGVPGDRLVKDHPSKPGCLVVPKSDSVLERAETDVV
ncbi:MAG: DUF3267 domain-containing protein [Rhodothermales bacterium]